LANAFDTSKVITNAWFSMKNYVISIHLLIDNQFKITTTGLQYCINITLRTCHNLFDTASVSTSITLIGSGRILDPCC